MKAKNIALLKIKNQFISKPFSNLIRTALFDYHKSQNAKMVPFEGFEMPVQYTGITDEHFSCRNKAAIFDVSHMGQVRVYGKDRKDFIENLCVADLKEVKLNSGALTVFTNDKGGIIDDSIVTNMDGYLSIVFNAGRKLIDLKNLTDFKNKYFVGKDITIEHLTDRSLIALQGPLAASILQEQVTGNLSNLNFMEQAKMEIPKLNEVAYIMRCGYTGEDGFEISVTNEKALALVELLYSSNNKQQGVKLAGLGCRDTLRLEAGLCLYGHDLNESITPVQASLKWLIGKRRKVEGKFKGFEVINKQLKGEIPIGKVRAGFLFEEGPPAREGSIISDFKGKEIGKVCSGTHAPSLKKNIGMAYIEPSHTKIGEKLLVKVRNKDYPMTISKMPFVKSNYFRKNTSI